MKKLTGTILLASALIAHVGIIIATEESYIFSAADYETTQQVTENVIPAALTSLPASNNVGVMSTQGKPAISIVEANFAKF